MSKKKRNSRPVKVKGLDKNLLQVISDTQFKHAIGSTVFEALKTVESIVIKTPVAVITITRDEINIEPTALAAWEFYFATWFTIGGKQP